MNAVCGRAQYSQFGAFSAWEVTAHSGARGGQENMKRLQSFSAEQVETVDEATSMAEELVSNAYKMSASQWLRNRYDVKTLVHLSPHEIVEGPFAQVIRYLGKKEDCSLGSLAYDFYKICLQDHSILAALARRPDLELFPFALYILSHELIHIIRFSKFLQSFHASEEEKMAEEARVHARTREILEPVRVSGVRPVFDFYSRWHAPLDVGVVSLPSAS